MKPLISTSQVKTVRSLQQKKFRDELGLFVAEGEKCIGELRSHFELVLLADESNATRVQIEQMSGMKNPQGSIAVFRKRAQENTAAPEELVLALDGIQDPGNLGTIIRTCDWFGIHRILCSAETCDCYSPKVVQATMGALGRVRIEYTDLHRAISDLREAGMPVYGTLLDGKNMYHEDAFADTKSGVIVMGNEGNGISPEIRSLITHPLYIPSCDGEHVESLNVAIATGIVISKFLHH